MENEAHEFYRQVKIHGLDKRRLYYEQLRIPLLLYEMAMTLRLDLREGAFLFTSYESLIDVAMAALEKIDITRRIKDIMTLRAIAKSIVVKKKL